MAGDGRNPRSQAASAVFIAPKRGVIIPVDPLAVMTLVFTDPNFTAVRPAHGRWAGVDIHHRNKPSRCDTVAGGLYALGGKGLWPVLKAVITDAHIMVPAAVGSMADGEMENESACYPKTVYQGLIGTAGIHGSLSLGKNRIETTAGSMFFPEASKVSASAVSKRLLDFSVPLYINTDCLKLARWESRYSFGE